MKPTLRRDKITPRVTPLHLAVINKEPHKQKLKFLEDLAKANGYSYVVTADGGKFVLKHEGSEEDQYRYSYIGGDGKVIIFNDENGFFSQDYLEFWNRCNFEQAQNYLYDQRLLKIFTPILIKLNFLPNPTNPYEIMQKAVLLSPYSACQHGVTKEERGRFMDEINSLGGNKINTLKALKSLSSNFITEGNKENRNLSFKADDKIYYEHKAELSKSGRVFAEEKFSEFKKKAEIKPAEGMTDGGSPSATPSINYVEFHKIENYFDAEELPGAGGSAGSSDGSPDKSRTALVIFHANEKENSQTVISGDNIKIFEQKYNEVTDVITKGLLAGYEPLKNIKEFFEKGIENNSTEISASLFDKDEEKIKKLVNFKIANDFLECKIESQEQPINLVRDEEEVKLINDLIIASKGKYSLDNHEGGFDKFIKVFNYNFGKVGNAKLNSEERYDKTLNSKTDPQYHSMKNIFQAGISIRRDKDHPHLVDIVRVISEGEDPKKSPNLQFVAIKGQGDDDGKTTLTIKRQGGTNETIAGKVFFRKVELGNKGEVRFSSNIYYYDSAGKRKNFNINQIQVEGDESSKTKFLENLGMLKIRATNVKIANNQIEVTDSKMSALNNSDIFSEQSLIDRNLSKELQDVKNADDLNSPPPSQPPSARGEIFPDPLSKSTEPHASLEIQKFSSPASASPISSPRALTESPSGSPRSDASSPLSRSYLQKQ